MTRLFLALALVVLAGAPAADAQTVSEAAQAIELHYNRLGTLSIDFSQTMSYNGVSRETDRGTVSLYRPNRMRWDYSQPEGKLLVGDGVHLFMYNPYTNQVRTERVDENLDLRAPLAFLLGRLDFSRQFRNLRLETIEGRRALIGEGRSGQESYSKVEFYFEAEQDYRLSALRVYGRDESVTDFVFDNERRNPRLDEKLFTFQAPPGAEILPETSLSDNL